MSVLSDIAKIVRVTTRGVRATVSGTTSASRWVGRNVGTARQVSGAGNVGMMRLLDLHAVSCAGDTLVTIGLASTIFFGVPTGDARSRVALYLLVTMVPFALLAPVVGPLLDRFRHGRRFALAATMLGRAMLVWIIAGNLDGFGLYPAAFGVLALSRAYGVARSAAVPRLLPPGMGLSQAGARASVYGTVAGAIVGVLGAILYTISPQWPLWLASVIFLAGAIVALNLPPRADSDPPEVVPKLFHLPWKHRAENGDRVLSGRLVIATLIGSAGLRALYGFLLLLLAFSVRDAVLPGFTDSAVTQLALIGAALGLGTFLATAAGTGLHIRRPARLQAIGVSLVALVAIWATIRYGLGTVLLLGLVVAIANGLAKLALDATIQDRIPEPVRASAFAHAETLLMLAWVAGAAFGLIPFGGRLGLAVAALAFTAAAVRSIVVGWRLRSDILGRKPAPIPVPAPAAVPSPLAAKAPAPAPAPVSQRVPAGVQDYPAAIDDEPDDEAPPGYHIFRPSPPEEGISDPRTGG